MSCSESHKVESAVSVPANDLMQMKSYVFERKVLDLDDIK